MTNHLPRESINLVESLIDSENAEELKRTKSDIENNITKILKLIKNEKQTKKDGNTKRSRKEAELVGLTEDLHKQYQSLYALYDNVIEKVVSRRRNKKASVSSSDSDSEYFSSEEVDGNKRRSGKENQNEVLKSEAMESEGQLTSLTEEVKRLSQQKKDLELQVESQANEVNHLQDQVKELELLLKEKEGVVSNIEEKFNNSEDQAKSNIVKLMAQISELELETKSLRTQKDEMEEKIKFDKIEASTQRKELMEQLNVMQQQLDSLGDQNKELEAEMEKKGELISQYATEIENLKENLAETRSNEQTMKEEKEGFLAKIKDMELELEARSNQKNELEEKLRDTSYEVKHLMNENKALQDRNNELKAAMTERGEEISDFLRENESNENGASMEAMALKAEVNAMRLELDTLHELKTKLELQNERNQKEYAESIAKMENLNAKLAIQIADQEKTIKDQIATIDRISAEQKQTIITSNKFRLSQRLAERKMEELAEEFRKKMEDNIRLLHQRIHVAEQLNNENKNSCRITKQRYEQENKMLGEKVAFYEEELRTLKESASASASAATTSPKGFEIEIEFEAAINGLDVAAAKVEEQRECVVNSVSKMLCEVELAKDWIKKRNEEMKKMKENVDGLTVLLSEKEEQELVLRDKVWNLEAEVSRGGGEKLNLTKAVSQLEKKVGKLEKNVKEKDEELVSLGEKKREAIRQLCLVVEFHRDRCNYLRNLVTNTRLNKKT